jgi:hypothetical protein
VLASFASTTTPLLDVYFFDSVPLCQARSSEENPVSSSMHLFFSVTYCCPTPPFLFLQTFSPSTFTSNSNQPRSCNHIKHGVSEESPTRRGCTAQRRRCVVFRTLDPTRIGRRGNFSTPSDCLVGEGRRDDSKKKLHQQLHRLRPTSSPLSLVDLDQFSESRQELQVSSPGTVRPASDLASSTVTESRSTKKRTVQQRGRDKREHAMQSESTLAQSTGTGSDDSTFETASSLAPNSDADNVASPSPQAVPSRKQPFDTPDFAPSKSVRITLIHSTAPPPLDCLSGLRIRWWPCDPTNVRTRGRNRNRNEQVAGGGSQT